MSSLSHNSLKPILESLHHQVPELIEHLQLAEALPNEPWHNLEATLLPLLDDRLPLMIAVCGGANAGKSTLFNAFLGAELSPVRGDAGSTRRVLVAGNPEIFSSPELLAHLFEPFGTIPRPMENPALLMAPGPPVYLTHKGIMGHQVVMDTPDFDTGAIDHYLNRDVARQVLKSCNVFIYLVTNATYNNLENTRFMRDILTGAGMRKCILVYNCSRTFSDRQVMAHLQTTAEHIYGERKEEFLLGCFRTDTSDEVAAGKKLMTLRPVKDGDLTLPELLQALDPREIRQEQIDTALKAFEGFIRRVILTGHLAVDRLELYAGAVKLALSHSVHQGLSTVPLDHILQRMHRIWLDTSPPYLKLFRGVGRLLGTPARLVLSVLKTDKIPDDAFDANRKPDRAIEELRSKLVSAATSLREQVLANEIIAETTVNDPNGKGLIELVDRLSEHGGSGERRTPGRRMGEHPGAVRISAPAPVSIETVRSSLAAKSWKHVVDTISALAGDILKLSDDVELNNELTRLVLDFRNRMNIVQKTRESFFATLSVMPATLGIAYILTTGDPVGGSGIYAKLHGLFGMHDLWALFSIPASAGLDETGRKDLSAMLSPIVSRWLDNRAAIVRNVFEIHITADIEKQIQAAIQVAREQIQTIEELLKKLEEENR